MNESANASFVMRVRKDRFIKPFEKTPPGKVCPKVYELLHANGCPYGCDYCYLQLTFRYQEKPVVFSNVHDMLREVRQFLALSKPQVLHTGKLCDSLAFDKETGLTKALVPLFAAQDKHKLLLLTKSTNIQNLLDMPEHRNTIVSYSLNAPALAAQFERGAPTPVERLDAARKCQDAGYEVRVRIDPVIPVPGWRELYKPLVDEIVARLKTEGLRVTIGNIRYFRGLPASAKRKGADMRVFGTPMIFDPTDGRMRVPPPVRMEMHRWFRAQFPPEVEVYPCKEPPDVWKTLGLDPGKPRCNCAL